MASDRTFKVLNAVHRFALRISGGMIGGRLRDMPVVELTTTGRRSGRSRTVMLTSPLQEGSTIVVVASRGGDDQHPAWYLNLIEDGDVTVAVSGGSKEPMTARVASPQERARLWPLLTAAQDDYADYQARTDREIPVVLLEPVR